MKLILTEIKDNKTREEEIELEEDYENCIRIKVEDERSLDR